MSKHNTVHDLNYLLQTESLPEIRVGDTIPFPDKNVKNLWAASLVLVDAIGGEYKPIFYTDEKFLQKRLARGKVTGLVLDQLLIKEYSEFDLSSDNDNQRLEGWMSIVTGKHTYPGYGKIALEFLYVVLKGSKYYRIGPYNEKTKKIDSITNPEIERALKVNASIMPTSSGSGKTTPRHLSSGAHY